MSSQVKVIRMVSHHQKFNHNRQISGPCTPDQLTLNNHYSVKMVEAIKENLTCTKEKLAKSVVYNTLEICIEKYVINIHLA